MKSDPTEWLLEKDNPSVRYRTLTEILHKPYNDPEVKATQQDIMTSGIVTKILSRQHKDGYWGNPEDFYVRSKYKGTVWQLIILAELGVDSNDSRIKNACECILEYSQDRESGGFSYSGSKKNGGHHSNILPCLTGNMVWSLIRFGYLDDPRVLHGIEWIDTCQRYDDGDGDAPAGWPYDKYEMCWGKHTCLVGIVKALKACAEIPVDARSPEVQNIIEKGVEFLLKHHLYKRSHNLNRLAKAAFIQFSFPTLWAIDALEMVLVLSKLGYGDERMQDALDLIISKRNDHGRWLLDRTYNGRFITNIERKGKESKWITLNALKAIMIANYLKN